MSTHSRLIHWMVLGGLGGLVLAIAAVFVTTLMPNSAKPLPVYGDIPDFTLTNQFSRVVSLADLRGKVWIADIIFTRCPGPCAAMTGKMRAIQQALPPGSDIQLVSLTADPEFDTPKILKEYADRFKADSRNWHLLTGPKQTIYDLAMHGLKLAVEENSQSQSIQDQFIHSTRLVVVDRHGRLRGVSREGTEFEVEQEVVRMAQQLEKET